MTTTTAHSFARSYLRWSGWWNGPESLTSKYLDLRTEELGYAGTADYLTKRYVDQITTPDDLARELEISPIAIRQAMARHQIPQRPARGIAARPTPHKPARRRQTLAELQAFPMAKDAAARHR